MSKSAEALAQLLEERLRPGADVADVDRRIVSLFGEKWCLVFTDMAGFSRRCAEEGIIPFLALIHELDKICTPIIQRNAGFVLKKIADSYMIIFRDPRAALRACLEMQQALRKHNEQVSEANQLLMGCGIGYGDCLKLGDDDIFGVEVNYASRLGEDLAQPYDIFLTPSALDAVGEFEGVAFSEVAGGRIGAREFHYFKASYGAPVLPPAPPAKKPAKKAKPARRR